MKRWADKKAKVSRLTKEIAALDKDIDELTDHLKDLQEQQREDKRQAARDARDGIDDGGSATCVKCALAGRSRSSRNGGSTALGMNGSQWGSLLGGIALGGLSMFSAYKTNQYISNNNARNGYFTPTPSAASYGFPYLAQGLYGAVNNGGGVGAGAFGCSGSMGGAFANGPLGMNNPYGLGFGNGLTGYPPGFTPTPWGGGMYMNGASNFGAMGPGALGNCLTFPCANGGSLAGGAFGQQGYPPGFTPTGIGNFGGSGGIIPSGGYVGSQFGLNPYASLGGGYGSTLSLSNFGGLNTVPIAGPLGGGGFYGQGSLYSGIGNFGSYSGYGGVGYGGTSSLIDQQRLAQGGVVTNGAFAGLQAEQVSLNQRYNAVQYNMNSGGYLGFAPSYSFGGSIR